jgi:ribosomal-protein-alanine N-acetyltransferase
MTLSGIRTRVFVDRIEIGEAARLAELQGGGSDPAWSEHECAALLSAQGVTALGVRRQSVAGARKLIGFMLMRVIIGQAEVLSIAVAASRRGRGYGRLLMEEALRRLYAAGVESCFLEVDSTNIAAVGLYKSLGFEPAGERKGREASVGTALVMRRKLR